MRSAFIFLLLIALGCAKADIDYKKAFLSPNDPPMGSLDSVKYEKGQFYAAGWAADKEDGVPLKNIIVYIDSKPVGVPTTGIKRDDVAQAHVNQNWLMSGWEIKTELQLPKGNHIVFFIALDKNNAIIVSEKKNYLF